VYLIYLLSLEFNFNRLLTGLIHQTHNHVVRELKVITQINCQNKLHIKDWISKEVDRVSEISEIRALFFEHLAFVRKAEAKEASQIL
jgi:hypothetical protein